MAFSEAQKEKAQVKMTKRTPAEFHFAASVIEVSAVEPHG